MSVYRTICPLVYVLAFNFVLFAACVRFHILDKKLGGHSLGVRYVFFPYCQFIYLFIFFNFVQTEL